MIVRKDLCTGCGVCMEECFLGALSLTDRKAVLDSRRCIGCGHCAARCPSEAIRAEGTPEDDVLPYDLTAAAIEPDRLLRFMKLRRSSRAFQPACVTREELDLLLQAARFAGSGGNRQPLRYLVLQESLPAVRALAVSALEAMATENERQGKPGFYSATCHAIYQAAQKGKDTLFYHAPQVILTIADKAQGLSPQADGLLATAYLQLMGEALGVGSCVNGFFLDAVRAGAALRAQLKLQPEELVVSAVAVGYPSVRYLRSVGRKPLAVTWQ